MPPTSPGLHTQGDSLDEATDNAREALELYVEGLREEGRSLDTGVVRRKPDLGASSVPTVTNTRPKGYGTPQLYRYRPRAATTRGDSRSPRPPRRSGCGLHPKPARQR